MARCFFFSLFSVSLDSDPLGYLWDSMDVSKNRGTPKWMVYNGKPNQNG